MDHPAEADDTDSDSGVAELAGLDVQRVLKKPAGGVSKTYAAHMLDQHQRTLRLNRLASKYVVGSQTSLRLP